MPKQTLGAMIAALRKEKHMTQLELAEKMGVTDKAVSKWERDLSCPDITSMPELAEVLGVSVEELMRNRISEAKDDRRDASRKMTLLVLKAVPLAMGTAVTVLSVLKEIELNSGMGMLGIGLFCLALLQLMKGEQK